MNINSARCVAGDPWSRALVGIKVVSSFVHLRRDESRLALCPAGHLLQSGRHPVHVMTAICCIHFRHDCIQLCCSSVNLVPLTPMSPPVSVYFGTISSINQSIIFNPEEGFFFSYVLILRF